LGFFSSINLTFQGLFQRLIRFSLKIAFSGSLEDKKVIKGTRYLLLRAKEKLQETPEKQSRLKELLALNENLNKV
jgi:hypothetical protein